jgi:hypothetical protein
LDAGLRPTPPLAGQTTPRLNGLPFTGLWPKQGAR